MNYRHAFHAGNFADLAKHAILTRLLRELVARPGGLTVIDTHAGAGLYDLAAEASRRTGEGEAGVARLMADTAAPPAFDDLKAAVRRVNPQGKGAPGQGRYYPGSPVLIAAALRPRDHTIFCELRADDVSALKRVLPRELGALVHLGDGWAHAAKVAPTAPAALLALIDPPFEAGDDYAQAARLTGRLLQVNRGAVIAIWTPLKDLATFDSFLGELEDTARGASILAAEVRLRPLTDPMRLNGCAMIVVNPPPALEDHARTVVDWIARTLGEDGAIGRIQHFSPRWGEYRRSRGGGLTGRDLRCGGPLHPFGVPLPQRGRRGASPLEFGTVRASERRLCCTATFVGLRSNAVSWMTEIADPTAIRERTMKSLAVPMGLANPLWLAFGAAASTGAAWWLLTRWANPFHAEALLARAAPAPAAPVLEMAETVLEAVAPAPAVEEPAPAVPPVVEAAPEPLAEPPAPAVDVAAEALTAPAEIAVEAVEAETAAALEAVAETEDDLTRLVGVGPRSAAALVERGVTRFAHLAAWTDEELAAFDAELKLKGRSLRNAWRTQAKRLAAEG